MKLAVIVADFVKSSKNILTKQKEVDITEVLCDLIDFTSYSFSVKKDFVLAIIYCVLKGKVASMSQIVIGPEVVVVLKVLSFVVLILNGEEIGLKDLEIAENYQKVSCEIFPLVLLEVLG